MAHTSSEEREKLQILEDQIADVGSRLGKLYDAWETGKFRVGELAPRIKALTQKREELQCAKSDIKERLWYKMAPHNISEETLGVLPLVHHG